ncbi:MAG: hypothetical protein JRJ84_21860 [Deltaproteobacteria bacterium]|nr:hypothetical protein [Deltaproteobacteria bacterium]
MAVGAMGAAVVLLASGCGQEGEVCEGPWLPDGLAITGVVVGGFGAGALAAATMRARRGLRNMDVMVTASPGLMAWAFVAATAAGFATWIDLRRPTEYLPKMPAIRDTRLMGLTVGLAVASYGFGIWQYALVKRAGRDLQPEPDEAATPGASLMITPWASRDIRGIAILASF